MIFILLAIGKQTYYLSGEIPQLLRMKRKSIYTEAVLRALVVQTVAELIQIGLVKLIFILNRTHGTGNLSPAPLLLICLD